MFYEPQNNLEAKIKKKIKYDTNEIQINELVFFYMNLLFMFIIMQNYFQYVYLFTKNYTSTVQAAT